MEPEEILSLAELLIAGIWARGHHMRLDYGGVSIGYHSHDAVVSGWIGQFLAGYFLPSDTAAAEDLTIYATADRVLFAALAGRAPQPPAGEKHPYVEVPLTDSVTLVRKSVGDAEPPEDVYLLLYAQQRRILLVGPDRPEVQREEGMQTLRSAGKWLLLERGWIPMHAACAAKHGRAICVAGGKASGKTSTLLNLLARNGCDLVAPDKFLLRDDGSRLEVLGVPGKIGIRVGSVLVQPRLLDWLDRDEASFFPHLSHGEVQHIAETNTPEQLRGRKEKIPLLPTELAGLFGGSVLPTAPLGLLLIPHFDPDLDETRLVPARPEQAVASLMDGYAGLLSKGEGYLLDFFDLDDSRLEKRLAGMLEEHGSDVPAYEVHQSHLTNEQTAKLVADLL